MENNTIQEGQAGEVGRHMPLRYSGVSLNDCETPMKANDCENRAWNPEVDTHDEDLESWG